MNHRHLARLFDQYRSHGSTAALARVFDETAPALLAVARRIARERADAEDAVQATFLVAIEKAATWDAARPLEPWLFGILVKQLGVARRRAARAIDPARLDAERLDDPALDIERSEIVATVADAVRLLPATDRVVLEPWLFDELRGGELARRAGISGSTLRMRLRRGLARLRRALPAGFGATAVVLSGTDRSALANVKGSVLAAAAKSGGAGAIAAAATTVSASGAVTSFGAKVAAAALLAAVVLGGGSLLLMKRGTPELAAQSSSMRRKDGGEVKLAAAPLSARRELDEHRTESDSARPIATTRVTVGGKEKESPEADAITGTVVDAHGEPISDATVLVFADDARGHEEPAVAETAADGTFHFERLRASGVHVVARVNGIGRAAMQTAPGAAHVRLVLGDGARFEGRVVDERGTPVPAAAIELADEDARFVGTQSSTTDADGRYRVESVRGRVRYVRAVTSDPRRFGFTVLDPADDRSSASSDVVVRPTRRVEFTVVAKADGQPVARAIVVVRAGGDLLGTAGLDARGGRYLDVLEPFVIDATSDAAGRVEIVGVPTSDDCSVTVAVPDFTPLPRLAPMARSFATTGDAPVCERIELEPACTIEGVVRRADGTLISGATVEVEEATPLREMRARPGSLDVARLIMVGVENSPWALETKSRADGTFTLGGLPPLSACNLRVELNRRVAYAWINALSAGETRRDVVITFDAKVRVEGTIVAEDGAVPEETRLWLQPASDIVHPDGDGRFAFDLAPHGTATIWAVAPGYVHERCDVAAPLPAVSRVSMTLHRGASISGIVVDAQKNAVAGARLIVWPAQPTFEERRKTGGWISEANLAMGTSRNDGHFEIRGLPDRPLRLVVSAEGFADAELTPVDPSSADLSVTLRAAR